MGSTRTHADGKIQPKRSYRLLLMAAHLADDLNQGALVAVMPFLVLHQGYSYAAVTALLLASNVASAVIQPLFGWIGDKHPRPWLMAAGIFLAGLGMAGIGLIDSYPLVLASAMLSGIGVAMFHPEGGTPGQSRGGRAEGVGHERLRGWGKARLHLRSARRNGGDKHLGHGGNRHLHRAVIHLRARSTRIQPYVPRFRGR